MGYRLFVRNKSHTRDFYGMKHYGYGKATWGNKENFPSYQFLSSIGKSRDGDMFIDFESEYKEGPIILTHNEFITFIDLYVKEFCEKNEMPYDTKEALEAYKNELELLKNDSEDKEVSWG